MADKAITELVAAEDIGATDLFVLQQNNTAKKLPGQVLLNWLTRAADGHGGIQSIVKKSTSGLVDTYRITLADTTTFDFKSSGVTGGTFWSIKKHGSVNDYFNNLDVQEEISKKINKKMQKDGEWYDKKVVFKSYLYFLFCQLRKRLKGKGKNEK